MTIRISFSDKTVRVAVEINGAIESKITELPQRPWVGLMEEEIISVNMSTVTKLIDEPIVCDTDHNIIQLGKAIEAKLKERNT
jgi:hypothetical protein